MTILISLVLLTVIYALCRKLSNMKKGISDRDDAFFRTVRNPYL